MSGFAIWGRVGILGPTKTVSPAAFSVLMRVYYR